MDKNPPPKPQFPPPPPHTKLKSTPLYKVSQEEKVGGMKLKQCKI